MDMQHRRQSSIAGVILLALFLAMLWLPQVDNCLNILKPLTGAKESALAQMRKMPPMPLNRDTLKLYQRIFTRLFIDHFELRNTLIRWNSLMKIRLLRVNQFPKVLIGREDWLYLIKDDNNYNVFEYYRAIKPFTPETMEAWIRPIRTLQAELAKQGIRYVFMLVPMKTSVYPEYIPPHLAPVNPRNRREQIVEYLRTHTDIPVVDACEPVRAARDRYQVFYKHDVHWNTLGAFFGYHALASHLAQWYPAIKPRELGDFTVKQQPVVGGDLARMLGIEDQFHDQHYDLVPRYTPLSRRMANEQPNRVSRLSEIYTIPGARLPRAVVFHDSFFNYLKQIMAEHFETMACYQAYNRIDRTIIETMRPDVVIHEMAECYLLTEPDYFTFVK